jgi:hypothetical protein
MSTNNSKLLSGRVPVTPYSNLTSDRYQFLSLGQAEPSLGNGTNNSVLTISTSNTRVWSNTLSLSSLTVNGVSNLGAIANVKITGGSSGQIITTDGTGNLTFSAEGGGFGNLVAPMPTYIATSSSYLVSANFQGLFTYPITVDGSLVVDGVLAQVDAIYNASNTQVIFTDGSNYVGNTNFTFNKNTGTMLAGNVYTSNRVGYNYANGVSAAYTVFNSATSSIDTVFG